MLLIYFLFFYTSEISIFQNCLFSDWSPFPSFCSWIARFEHRDHFAFPFPLPPGAHWTHWVLFSKLILELQACFGVPQIWLISSVCGPSLVSSFCLNRQHFLLCFVAQDHEDNSSSEDLNSLLLHSVNKSTLEGKNHFPTSFFPLPPFKYKIEAPGIAFLCRYHTTTSSPDL